MKKVISLITAAALAAGAFGALTANAEYDRPSEYTKEHFPYLYFKAYKEDYMTMLRQDYVYINKNDLKEDTSLLDVEIYMYSKDFKDRIGDTIFVWGEHTKTLKVTNPISTYNKYGKSPFKEYEDDKLGTPHVTCYDWDKPKDDNQMSVMFLIDRLGVPLHLTTENTDDLPLACFSLEIPIDVPEGSYEVDFARPEFDPGSHTYCPHATVVRYEEGEKVTPESDVEVHGVYETSPSLVINISDRDLGDTDENETVDEDDAKDILFDYARRCNNYETPDYILAASDVNADREVDELDVEMIMDYTLLYGGEEQPEIFFMDYVKQQIGEE